MKFFMVAGEEHWMWRTSWWSVWRSWRAWSGEEDLVGGGGVDGLVSVDPVHCEVPGWAAWLWDKFVTKGREEHEWFLVLRIIPYWLGGRGKNCAGRPGDQVVSVLRSCW